MGRGGLAPGGGRIYGADSPVIREFDPATGRTLRLGPGLGVFSSADGRHAYVERTSTSLAELRASGRGVLPRLHTPAGWYLVPNAADKVTAGVGGGGILVSSRPGGPSRTPWNLATWDPATGKVALVARSAVVVGAYTPPGGRYSLIAWAPAPCMSGNCPIEITNTATRATVTARSPLPHGFAQGAAFSPDGTRLAIFERTASINSSCCANNSVLAIVNARAGAVHAIPAARLVTEEEPPAGSCGCPAGGDCWPGRCPTAMRWTPPRTRPGRSSSSSSSSRRRQTAPTRITTSWIPLTSTSRPSCCHRSLPGRASAAPGSALARDRAVRR